MASKDIRLNTKYSGEKEKFYKWLLAKNIVLTEKIKY